MISFVSVEFLEANKFEKIRFADGMFWIRRCHNDVFVQVSEDLLTVTNFEFGWVDDVDNLEALVYILSQYKDIK